MIAWVSILNPFTPIGPTSIQESFKAGLLYEREFMSVASGGARTFRSAGARRRVVKHEPAEAVDRRQADVIGAGEPRTPVEDHRSRRFSSDAMFLGGIRDGRDPAYPLSSRALRPLICLCHWQLPLLRSF